MHKIYVMVQEAIETSLQTVWQFLINQYIYIYMCWVHVCISRFLLVIQIRLATIEVKKSQYVDRCHSQVFVTTYL